MSWMNKLKGSLTQSGGSRFRAALEPEQPFFVIGDIHGQFHALEALLMKIEERNTVSPVICVGDYVDRGEFSAHVLTWLKHLTDLYPDFFICLRGNHEQMMSNFIEDPETHGDRWLRYGGLQTLSSFGIGRSGGESLTSLRDKLVDEMNPEMVDWLRGLPLTWQSGNVFVCHAGADPQIPVEYQSHRVLLWGHQDFGKIPRQDGVWVVHGHTIVDAPVASQGVISVDTGAYATGTLTAALISAAGVEFLRN